MGLYRVMLVDDEEDVRQAIARKINWEEIGFQVVASAENGQEALELAERLHPDVVMTDIKMPFMDGLTLGRALKKRLKNIKVIIFSGFDEFEYAKEAIKLEAEEYLLKPLNAAELETVFKRIRENLDREIDQKRNESRLNAYYQESLPIMREQFLIGLLEGRIPDEEIDKTMASYEMEFKAGHYAVAVGTVERTEDAAGRTGESAGAGAEEAGKKSPGPVSDARLLNISLKQILDENMAGSIGHRTFIYLDRVVTIALFDDEEKFPYFVYLMDQVCKIARRVLDANTSIGIGSPCDKRSKLGISYREAKSALDYRVLVDANQAIYIKDVEPKAEAMPDIEQTSVQDILREMKLGTREDLEGVIHVFVKNLKNSKMALSQYQIFLMELVAEIYKLGRNYEIDMNQIFPPKTNLYENLYQLDSPEAVGSWMLDICMKVRHAIRRERADSTKAIMERAIQYVQDNYQESDLSVEGICSALNVSPTYFSTLFKKELGTTFVAYVTNVRMERAVELLQTTEDKTYVIAAKVGYTEPNYFSYVFKKQYGISPSKYRTGKTKEEK